MNARHLLFPLLFGGILSANTATNAQAVQRQQPAPHTLFFVENKGQITDQHSQPRTDVHFRSGGSGVSLFVGSGKLHYQWAKPLGDERTALYRMDVSLIGADPQAQFVAEQKQSYYERYYTTAAGQGLTAHAFQKITYRNVYPNIDWVLYVRNNAVEYDFVVRPGGKVSDIKLQYGGTTALAIDKAGKLTATTPMGSVTEAAPVSYQADGKAVASSFVLQGNTLGFATGDYSGTLVIDPTLSWATYYGDIGVEAIRNGCVSGDKYGNGYFGGNTGSAANIATTGSYMDTIAGTTDAFLVKFSSSGTRLWATYYGGVDYEYVYGITCDTFGNAYLSGYTQSTAGIATTGSFQTSLNGGTDAFLVKFDTGGVRQWATYFGGSGTEQCFGVTCDKANNVYICGYTQSSSAIASSGAHQTTYGGANDAFIAKFSSSGVFRWASYYGGSLLDYGQSVACDTSRNVYLAGYTRSTTGIATTGAYQTSWTALDDAFLVKFDSAGVRQWGTYYGDAKLDRAYGVCTDPENNVYITGNTTSISGIATTGAAQDTLGGGLAPDAFLAKFSGSGVRKWGTYYGGAAIDNGSGVCADGYGHIYLTGRTASITGIATTGAWKDTLDGTTDAMLARFDTAGVRQWATYFGGDADETGYGVYCNQLSQVFLGGQTSSSIGLATTGAFHTSYGGSDDGFLAVFNDCDLNAPAAITGNDTVCRNASYTYSVPAVTGAISYTWIIPAGWSGTSSSNTITVTAGANSDTLRVTANFPCGTSIATIMAITVSPLPIITPSGVVSICAGDSVILSASTGAAYQWYRNDTAIAGAINPLYTARIAGRYAVIVTSSQGCADTSLIDTILVHPLPVPVIAASGTVLSTGTYATYQWNHNGSPITGATGVSYTILITSGNYTVTVTDANGCEGTSAPFDGGTVGIDDLNGKSNAVRIYPNPATDRLYIDAKEKINVTISSMEGRTEGFYTNAKDIDVSHLSNGLYLLRITDKSGALLQTEKLVISRSH
ncbi:MAG: SBBP repeat-containing protein [Bacteroidetes bacterium]|nr:SBBP repeat-containing protein [Bacteroidota bacterium]